MKRAYPVILRQGKKMIVVDIPDFDVGTQGHDIAEAMEMARDAIGLLGIDMQDDGEAIPEASELSSIQTELGQMVTLVDVDFDEYRRRNELRTVRRNCTLPAWLDYEAEKAGVNVSGVLQDALKEKLGVSERRKQA